MPYAQIDVSAPRHRKLSTLSDAAFRLWVLGLCYCQEHLTDGVLHSAVVPTLLRRVPPKIIAELVNHGLWDPDPDNGWRVHDYLAWNESRAQVEARRAKWRARPRGTSPKASEEAGPERTGCTAPDVHGGVHRGVHGTLRSDPIRSTDQEQEQRPTGRPTPLRTTRTDEPPKPKVLAAIAGSLLGVNPDLTGADLKEALKQKAASLRVAYDAASIRKALDGVEYDRGRRRRERQA